MIAGTSDKYLRSPVSGIVVSLIEEIVDSHVVINIIVKPALEFVPIAPLNNSKIQIDIISQDMKPLKVKEYIPCVSLVRLTILKNIIKNLCVDVGDHIKIGSSIIALQVT